jgi:hypothetical protein
MPTRWHHQEYPLAGLFPGASGRRAIASAAPALALPWDQPVQAGLRTPRTEPRDVGPQNDRCLLACQSIAFCYTRSNTLATPLSLTG